MQHLAWFARFSLIALVWFSAMLGFAALFTIVLSSPYQAAELGPLARTLTTMSLAILAATMVVALGRSMVRRAAMVLASAVHDREAGGDASFARIG